MFSEILNIWMDSLNTMSGKTQKWNRMCYFKSIASQQSSQYLFRTRNMIFIFTFEFCQIENVIVILAKFGKFKITEV